MRRRVGWIVLGVVTAMACGRALPPSAPLADAPRTAALSPALPREADPDENACLPGTPIHVSLGTIKASPAIATLVRRTMAKRLARASEIVLIDSVHGACHFVLEVSETGCEVTGDGLVCTVRIEVVARGRVLRGELAAKRLVESRAR